MQLKISLQIVGLFGHLIVHLKVWVAIFSPHTQINKLLISFWYFITFHVFILSKFSFFYTNRIFFYILNKHKKCIRKFKIKTFLAWKQKEKKKKKKHQNKYLSSYWKIVFLKFFSITTTTTNFILFIKRNITLTKRERERKRKKVRKQKQKSIWAFSNIIIFIAN